MTLDEYKRILTAAIGDEAEAFQFYSGVAEKVQDSALKRIFADLAQEEKGHREFLEGVLSGSKPMQVDETKDYRISATVDKPKLTMAMRPVEAIALAMKNEEEAMTMYTGLASVSIDEEQKSLFQSLAHMEKGHKVRLEDMYTNMAFPEAW